LPHLHAEYLVVGAGPAGLTVARLLSLKGRAVVVVDPELKVAKRLELLAPVSFGTIAALDLASLLDDPTISRPCLGIRRRWDSAVPEYEDFFRHPRRTGYVVDRARFDDRLRAAAVGAGVDFVKARLTGVESDGRGVRLASFGSRPETFDFAGTIVDATGRAAVVARRKGACVTICEKINAELIEETSVQDVASAPAWLDVQKLDVSSWSYQIHGIGGQAQTWRIRRSGTRSTPGALRRVDASARILSNMAGDGWIAVGDAASAFDPIASQGLFNALSSALVACGALISRDGLSIEAARLYSDALMEAFIWSEAARSNTFGVPHSRFQSK
jgi:flavin-dependent dehydrogenase